MNEKNFTVWMQILHYPNEVKSRNNVTICVPFNTRCHISIWLWYFMLIANNALQYAVKSYKYKARLHFLSCDTNGIQLFCLYIFRVFQSSTWYDMQFVDKIQGHINCRDHNIVETWNCCKRQIQNLTSNCNVLDELNIYDISI